MPVYGKPRAEHLHEALNNLYNSLSDPSSINNEHDRIKLTNSFREFEYQFLSSSKLFRSESSTKPTTETQSESLDNEISGYLNGWNLCSNSESGIDATPSNDLESDRLKQALDCFFLLKESVIKKRDLVYWWVGQGLIEPEDGKDLEDAADTILTHLIHAGAIEQVFNIRSQRKSSKYKLNLSNHEKNQKVGLLKKQGTKLLTTSPNDTIIDEELQSSIETLFNPGVSMVSLKQNWIRKMKNVKVIHLGRWSSDPMEHIEIEKEEYLKELKYLKQMRFISFKGISRIIKLCKEICYLENLRVLDLQSCPNLEELPKGIGMLKNLTHLDVSECYLLDRIPKGITSLTKLQVLKGFVISDVKSSSSCKFKDLANHLGMTLTKLSIRARTVNFPAEEDELKAFARFEKLLKLKIVWIKISDQSKQVEVKRNITTQLPKRLQKLEVQAIPQAAVQRLLLDSNDKSKNLKKLYIIGGVINDLTDNGKIKWDTVETLQLKYLSKLHMTWRQFKVSFPNISYLEVFRCPHLSFFPCDHNGIWKPVDDDL
ncbi:unnamed protein product [Amaranthus hypochondriacus]